MVERDPFVDLVHRELDGEISPEEQRLLQRLLADDAGKREFRERLRLLHETLRRVPDLEPPDALRPRVLEASAFSRPRPTARGGRDVSERGVSSLRGRMLRLAPPLAAGLLGGAILAGWWLGAAGSTTFDPAAISGAMGAGAAHGASLDTATMQLDGLRASASLHAGTAGRDLILQVDSRVPTEIILDCALEDCAVRGFAWLDGAGDEARLDAGRLRVPISGATTLAVRLAGSRGLVRLEFVVEGESRGRLVLTAGDNSQEN